MSSFENTLDVPIWSRIPLNNGMSNQVPERPEINFKEENDVAKLARKTKENPLMPIGLTGCALVAAYGFYKFKNRGHLSVSNYLMQLRVTAQGVVIGCLTLGVIKSLYDNLTKPRSSDF